MSTIVELKTEIETAAKKFWSGSVSVRETFYTMPAASVLSEADARALTVAGAFFVAATEGEQLKIVPKAPQRKNDGDRGPQMNFWLYDSNDAYYQKFNVHVDVTSLEKKFKLSLAAAGKASGWELQPKELERQANKAARDERTANNWTEFAKKPG